LILFFHLIDRESWIIEEAAISRKSRFEIILKYSLPIFYLVFVFLWFKDNFAPFRDLKLHYSIALVPLLLILLALFYKNFRSRRIKFSFRPKKFFLALIILILLVTAFRIPFLVYHYSLGKDPDAGVSALMGKHISEGKVPPVFWYAQLRLGSLYQHLYAALFKIFGYSIFILRLMPLLIFLAFLSLQFLLISDIFSQEFSFITCLIYVMPLSHLGSWLSLDVPSGFSLVLFLGVLILYLTYLIYFKNKEGLISILGFILGLSFWVHQITAGFILTSLIFIFIKFKLSWKKYLNLFLSACVGSFPLLLSEFMNGFILTRYLFGGEKEAFNIAKLKNMGKMIIDLISREANPLNYAYLILILMGFGSIIFLSIKRREFLPQNLYVIFFAVFSLIYILSAFSEQIKLHRYLYPVFVALPVLLFSVFDSIKKKWNYILMFALFFTVLIFNNLKGIIADYSQTPEHHHTFKRVIAAIHDTKMKYWQSRYIRAILITALSKEDIIVDSYTLRKYYPYKLIYYDQKKRSNYIFLVRPEGGIEKEQATNLIRLLDRLGIEYNFKKIDLWWLIYGIEPDVFPHHISAPIPEEIPDLELVGDQISGLLNLDFEVSYAPQIPGFSLHVEIPGYSSKTKPLQPAEDAASLKIPFPRQRTFEINFYCDYRGMVIPSSKKTKLYSLPDALLLPRKKQKREIVYLAGFGPSKLMFGKQRTICEKEVSFQVNTRLEENEKIWLHVYSPFDFNAWYWYGNFKQRFRVLRNGRYLTEFELSDGENIVAFDYEESPGEDDAEIFTLEFKYAVPFEFAREMRVAALLEKIEIR